MLCFPSSLICFLHFFLHRRHSDGPAKVAPAWIMTFDLDTTFEGMKDRAQQSTQELLLGYGIGNTSEKQEVEPGTRVLPTIPGSLLCNLDRHAGDRYQRKGIYFVESTTRNIIAFSEVSTRLQRAEELHESMRYLRQNFS